MDALRASAKSLSMHVVAARPAFLDETVAPAQVLAKETKVYLQQAEESGKERKFWDKMVEGRCVLCVVFCVLCFVCRVSCVDSIGRNRIGFVFFCGCDEDFGI